MDYKLNLLTPPLYSQEGENNCKDELVERFAEYLKDRADNEFFMKCKHDPVPGLAFIHSFEDFEERFLVHSEYAVIIASEASQAALNKFIPRLLVFLTAKSIWMNRFIFVTLGTVNVLSNLVVNEPIRFSPDQWKTHDEVSWIELFDLIKIPWKPHIDESSEAEDAYLSTHLSSTQIEETKSDEGNIEILKQNEENENQNDEMDFRKDSQVKESEKVKQYTSRSVQGSRVLVDTLSFIPTEKEISFKEHQDSETNTSPQNSSTDEVDHHGLPINSSDDNFGQMRGNTSDTSSYGDGPRDETKDVILHDIQIQKLQQSKDEQKNKDEIQTESLMTNEIKEVAEGQETKECDQTILDQENVEETKVFHENELDLSRGLHQNDYENNKEYLIYSDDHKRESGINADYSPLLNSKDTKETLDYRNVPMEKESKLVDPTRLSEEERETKLFYGDKSISDDDKGNETEIILDSKLKMNEDSFQMESNLTNESCEVCDNLTNEYDNIVKNKYWKNNENENVNSQVNKTDDSREMSENLTDEFNNLSNKRSLENDESESMKNETEKQKLSESQDSTLSNNVNTKFTGQIDSCEVCENMSNEYSQSILNRHWEQNENQFIKKEDNEEELSKSQNSAINNDIESKEEDNIKNKYWENNENENINSQVNNADDSREMSENVTDEFNNLSNKRSLENDESESTKTETEKQKLSESQDSTLSNNVNTKFTGQTDSCEVCENMSNEYSQSITRRYWEQNENQFIKKEDNENSQDSALNNDIEYKEEEFKESIENTEQAEIEELFEPVKPPIIMEIEDERIIPESEDTTHLNVTGRLSETIFGSNDGSKLRATNVIIDDETSKYEEESKLIHPTNNSKNESDEEFYNKKNISGDGKVIDAEELQNQYTKKHEASSEDSFMTNEPFKKTVNNSSYSSNNSSFSMFSRLQYFPVSIWRRLFSTGPQSELQSHELTTATTKSNLSMTLVQSPWSVLLLFVTATAVSPYWVEFTTSSATRMFLLDTISSSVLPEDAINRRFAIIPHENQKS